MGFKLNNNVSLNDVFTELNLAWPCPRDYIIDGVSSLNDYSPNSLSFCNKATEVPADSILITDQKVTTDNIIYNDSPRTTFVRVLDWLYKNVGFDSFNQESIIHTSSIIGANVVIESGCIIGENVVIEPNVVIHRGTIIGKNSHIRSCSSIGSDGFGFERLEDGNIIRFPQLGRVIIGDNVEIGSCTAIARGSLSNTIIHDSVKIDNLVHIAHNVEIDSGAFIIACSEVSGSVKIGKNAWIAPNACINQKLTIGENSLVGLGAVVTKDVAPKTIVAGSPAKKIRDF